MDVLATYRTKPCNGFAPVLKTVKRSHMNMAVLRFHKRWAGISNSDMMPGVVAGLLRRATSDCRGFNIESPPETIRIKPDASGYMVTVELLG